MSDNNQKDDNLTVTRVYETLKSPTFLQNLYWDILSGIKEKNTYKLMRGIAEGLINQNLEVLNGLSNNDSDNLRRKTIVAEICAMSYAIDTVFSKILYIKLEKACRGQILNIIQQLRNEGKIPESVWSKFKIKTELPETVTSTENSVVKTNSIHQTKDIRKIPVRVGRKQRKVNSNHLLQDIKRANSNKEILEDLRKVNGINETDVDKNNANSKKGNFSKKKLAGRTKEVSKKNDSSPDANIPWKKLTSENVSLLNSVGKTTQGSATFLPEDSLQTDNQADASDAKSKISVRRASMSSVSSVHTSDLSSFDDEISLSSGDEDGEKRKVSLKEVQKKFSERDFSIAEKSDVESVESEEESDEDIVEDTKIEDSMDDPARSISKSASAQLSSENGLSKRARKPNSRYSSDNIICPPVKVKERKKPAILMSYKASGKMSSDESSPQNKKLKVDNDIRVDVATITKSINDERNTGNNDVKPPTKQPTTSDLFKSHSSNRSLTSRRTAPLTLFST